MLVKLQSLGIVPSLSRPSVSNDNAYAESLFRTLKYVPFYPKHPFVNLVAARQWVATFTNWYNNEHRHSAIQFVTPSQRHSGEHIEILERRKQLYTEARKLNPARWSGAIRNWNATEVVWLNKPANPEDYMEEKTREKA
jgi:putative transposase